jgi:hypothetical protein
MSEKINADELAKHRFAVVEPKPSFSNAMTDAHLLALAQEAQRTGYAAAIREVAQPIVDERDELREALEEVLKANPDSRLETLAALQHARAILAKYHKP